MSQTRHCSECKSERLATEFIWVNDRYGIPYKKVCWGCEEKVRREISEFVFDAAYAGESLEPEDY